MIRGLQQEAEKAVASQGSCHPGENSHNTGNRVHAAELKGIQSAARGGLKRTVLNDPEVDFEVVHLGDAQGKRAGQAPPRKEMWGSCSNKQESDTAVGLMEQREYTVVCAPGEMRSGSVNASLSKQRQLQSASDSLRKVSKD